MSVTSRTEEYLREGLSLGQAIALAVQDEWRKPLDVIEPEYDSSLM